MYNDSGVVLRKLYFSIDLNICFEREIIITISQRRNWPIDETAVISGSKTMPLQGDIIGSYINGLIDLLNEGLWKILVCFLEGIA